MITYSIMGSISNLLPSWGIYYLYYWKNRDNFKVKDESTKGNNSDFDELRSELISVESR